MDEIVKQAIAKWPDVPHCYGWLALDARGMWRMRDDRAQSLNLPGDRINNAALVGFINRNYLHDARGQWYFQNGPQRVYVNLEATPYIARTDPVHDFIWHTGQPVDKPDAAWLTDNGQLLLRNGEKIGMLDDRDMAQCLPRLRAHGKPVADDALLKWLAQPQPDVLTLDVAGGAIQVDYIAQKDIADTFTFIPEPKQD